MQDHETVAVKLDASLFVCVVLYVTIATPSGLLSFPRKHIVFQTVGQLTGEFLQETSSILMR
jgi:hypothetical protein